MATSEPQPESDEFDLAGRGAAVRLSRHLGLDCLGSGFFSLRTLLLVSVSWLPLAIMSLFARRAYGDAVEIPFFSDWQVHARFLLAAPLLEISRTSIAISHRAQVRQFIESGIVSEQDRSRFECAKAEALRWRDSPYSEIAVLILAFACPVVSRVFFGLSEGPSSWERADGLITLAGWGHTAISLPILNFFLLQGLLVLVCWGRFLYSVSRLDLVLTSTHPDRAGGLGFLGWGLASFAPWAMSLSIVFSAALANEIHLHGETLNSLKFHAMTFIAVILLVVYAPLLTFCGHMARSRFKGLLEFGKLVWQYDHEFDEKWIVKAKGSPVEPLLGNPDIQSMSDTATVYNHIDEMRMFPFDVRAFALLVLCQLIPMAPLVASAIPLKEIFMKFGELLI